MTSQGKWPSESQSRATTASESKVILDLSDAECADKLRDIFRQNPVASGHCNNCAEQVAQVLEQAAIKSEIVEIGYDVFPPASFLNLKDGTQAYTLGWHEVVEVTTSQGDTFYIDSVVYEQLYSSSSGLEAVPWETYQELWQYPDVIVQKNRRAPFSKKS